MEARRLQRELGVWKGDDLRSSEMEEKMEEREVGVRREGDGRERERSVGGESGEREGVRARWGELGRAGGAWWWELGAGAGSRAAWLGAKRATAQWRMEKGALGPSQTQSQSSIPSSGGRLAHWVHSQHPAPSTQGRRFKKGKMGAGAWWSVGYP